MKREIRLRLEGQNKGFSQRVKLEGAREWPSLREEMDGPSHTRGVYNSKGSMVGT
jgi:hypothetical protein